MLQKRLRAEDTRQILRDQLSEKQVAQPKNPLLKLNKLGQIVCKVCSGVLKTESLWTSHSQSQQHLEGIAALKAKQAELAKQKSAAKPAAKQPSAPKSVTFAEPTAVSTKRIPKPSNEEHEYDDDEDDEAPRVSASPAKLTPEVRQALINEINSIPVATAAPSDHEKKVTIQDGKVTTIVKSAPKKMNEATVSSREQLPHNFFDDRKAQINAQDAARKADVDLNAEIASFQQAIREQEEEQELLELMNLIEGQFDEEGDDIELPGIEEVDDTKLVEDTTKLSHLEELKRKTSELANKKRKLEPQKEEKKEEEEEEEDDDDDDDDDMDSFFNWRTKGLGNKTK